MISGYISGDVVYMFHYFPISVGDFGFYGHSLRDSLNDLTCKFLNCTVPKVVDSCEAPTRQLGGNRRVDDLELVEQMPWICLDIMFICLYIYTLYTIYISYR